MSEILLRRTNLVICTELSVITHNLLQFTRIYIQLYTRTAIILVFQRPTGGDDESRLSGNGRLSAIVLFRTIDTSWKQYYYIVPTYLYNILLQVWTWIRSVRVITWRQALPSDPVGRPTSFRSSYARVFCLFFFLLIFYLLHLVLSGIDDNIVQYIGCARTSFPSGSRTLQIVRPTWRARVRPSCSGATQSYGIIIIIIVPQLRMRHEYFNTSV